MPAENERGVSQGLVYRPTDHLRSSLVVYATRMTHTNIVEVILAERTNLSWHLCQMRRHPCDCQDPKFNAFSHSCIEQTGEKKIQTRDGNCLALLQELACLVTVLVAVSGGFFSIPS